MKNREIGHIITKGGSVEDIRKVIPKFPANPTKDTFVKLGYAESTAKRYISRLKQNGSNEVLDNMENRVEVKTTDILKNTLHSANANHENVLVDTCALGSEKGKEIIENAKQVTFIFATLEEMGKVQSMKKTIARYTNEILKGSNKYMLSKFNGYSEERYVDNILLQYLQILPKQIRPTLLTGDRNLAAKAASLELSYIFVQVNATIKKNLGYGITLYRENDELFINYKGSHCLEIHRNEDIVVCKTNEPVKVEAGEKLHLKEKIKHNIVEHIINI